MRSITYVLGGRPGNLDDCIDYAARHPLQRIILELRGVEQVSEDYVLRRLIATWVWVYADTAATFDVSYGGCFQHESPQRQRISIERANARLGRDLEIVARDLPGMLIEGGDRRFDASVMYPAQGGG